MTELKRIKELELLLASKNEELLAAQEDIQRANAKIEQVIDRLSKEIFYAQQVYNLLVPTELPKIPGFEFSSKFIASPHSGGDYYEIIENHEKLRFGILLASASGYTMSALFLGVLLKLSAQLSSRKSLLPSDFIQELSKDLKQSISEIDHLSIFYGIVDRRANELHYVSYGDIYASHWQQDEKALSILAAQGPSIDKKWLAGSDTIKQNTISLNPQDRLIVCSKGVYKSQNHMGEDFAHKNIDKIIYSYADQSIHELRNEILFQAEHHRQKQDALSDQSILIMDVKDRVIKLAKS